MTPAGIATGNWKSPSALSAGPGRPFLPAEVEAPFRLRAVGLEVATGPQVFGKLGGDAVQFLAGDVELEGGTLDLPLEGGRGAASAEKNPLGIRG